MGNFLPIIAVNLVALCRAKSDSDGPWSTTKCDQIYTNVNLDAPEAAAEVKFKFNKLASGLLGIIIFYVCSV